MAITDVRPATLRRVIDYLEEELGLSVYGATCHDGVEFPSCMDYDADAVIDRRKHVMNDTLEWSGDS